MDRSAELIIILPTGDSRDVALEFVGRCILYGLDFYFESGDRLPIGLPEGVKGVKAIVYDDSTEISSPTVLEDYQRKGAKVYRLKTEFDITRPTERRYWELSWLHDMLTMDAGLTCRSPRFIARMQGREEGFLFDSLAQGVMQHVETRWCEPARHQWEGLLDGYEVSGSKVYVDTLLGQVDTALEFENEADNCDAIAPLRAMLRLYEHTGDARLLEHARSTADAYIESAPRYRGCFVGFHWLSNHARAEIIFQVCPSLIYLYKVTEDERYLNVVLDQYERYEKLLSDPETGLWFHGASGQVKTAAYWSRGVAFVLLGILQITEHVPDTCPQKKGMIQTIQRMTAKICEYQHESGFWHKVIDEPDTQLESSGTAWMGGVLERALRLGWLEPSYRKVSDRAWEAVKTRIWMGRFPGTVGATTVSPDRAYYMSLPINPKGWSHFAFKFACERRRTDLAQRGVSTYTLGMQPSGA